jgi:hypothetical protein
MVFARGVFRSLSLLYLTYSREPSEEYLNMCSSLCISFLRRRAIVGNMREIFSNTNSRHCWRFAIRFFCRHKYKAFVIQLVSPLAHENSPGSERIHPKQFERILFLVCTNISRSTTLYVDIR